MKIHSAIEPFSWAMFSVLGNVKKNGIFSCLGQVMETE